MGHKLTTFLEFQNAYDIRYYATEAERDEARKTWGVHFPHVRPNSVAVISIGNQWVAGAWQRVIDMVEHTNDQGTCCWLLEIPDTSTRIPYQEISIMRDVACMHAHDQGFEWFLMIENDALPEKDMLLRLLNWNLPVVVPYIVDEKSGLTIASPHYKRGEGAKPVQWAAFTCMLIWTKVLNCFPCSRPFSDIQIESDFFNKLIHFGHRAWQDTGTELKISTRPTYPGSFKTLKEHWKFWEKAFMRRKQKPNRKPIHTEDKREVYQR